MDCPENSYERMCREIDRIMSDKPKFYYNSGIDARNVFCDIAENEGNNAFNASCDELYMFEELIGLHQEDEDV